MVIFFYNLLQFLLLPPLLPLLLPVVLLRKKYRKRTPQQLGVTLNKRLNTARERHNHPVLWIHALSTGETASALPLIERIRATMPDARIVFSTTTRSGQQMAERLPGGVIDTIIYRPLDILPVVHYFIAKIQPDCFLLIETDFWPNLLHSLNQKGVPSILLNGRVSHQALQGYRKIAFLCRPMFSSLNALLSIHRYAMRSTHDCRQNASACLPVLPMRERKRFWCRRCAPLAVNSRNSA